MKAIIEIEKKTFSIPWSAQSFLDCAQWKEFWIYVAEQNKKIAGYFVAQVIGDEAELHNIAVDPAIQKKGIGQILLDTFLDKAQKEGVQNIFLMVRPSNHAAIHLYQKSGFQLLDKRPRYYEDTHEDALVFCKRLI
ncbi:MAG: ribosomal protein S18-alanine N-acetyltransferase [Deltaproteobacteria bacterium]|nr:ribosomal protein S18-alanine N-acetyltransferase [Deltaproteobacteria bacterium]